MGKRTRSDSGGDGSAPAKRPQRMDNEQQHRSVSTLLQQHSSPRARRGAQQQAGRRPEQQQHDSRSERGSSLTPNAVKSVVSADKFTDPLLVKLMSPKFVGDDNTSRFCQAIMFDDMNSVDAFILSESFAKCVHRDSNKVYTVLVGGYITSPANIFQKQPFVCLTDFEISQSETCQDVERIRKNLKPIAQEPQTQRTQGGTAGTFLAERAPLYTPASLAGVDSLSHPVLDFTPVQSFINHYETMKTLHASPSSQAAEQYMKASLEFQQSQIQRQEASLTANAGKQAATGAALVVKQHKQAMEAAMAHADAKLELTPSTLFQWHAILGNGLVPHAGQVRTTQVRAGNTNFTPPAKITEELDKLCSSVKILEDRLQKNVSSGGNIGPLTLAAAVFVGVVDIHPFKDGNGRLARLAANWALRRAGLPFCINLFATPAQRRDYIDAIQATRRNLCLTSRGHVQEPELLHVIQSSGILLPLIQLLLEKTTKAVTEHDSFVQEKSLAAQEDLERQAAKRFREKAAQGTCIICFDEKPNIATLCCGKAVHLNCIAEWLSSKSSCPQCRGGLPSLPARAPAPAVRRDRDRFTTSDDTIDISDSTTDAAATLNDTTDSTTTDAVQNVDTTNDTTSTTGAPEDTTTDGTTTEVVARNHDDNTTLSTTEDTAASSDDTTAERDVYNRVLPPFCSHENCRNRAAEDCANQCCGRCCVISGTYACLRHNT